MLEAAKEYPQYGFVKTQGIRHRRPCAGTKGMGAVPVTPEELFGQNPGVMNSGQFGEAYVAWRLEKKGARILARNWHSRYGEIDIIAQYQKRSVCRSEHPASGQRIGSAGSGD